LKGAKPGAAGMGSDAPLRRMRCAYLAYDVISTTENRGK
jgi:hypothetical protein